MNPFFENSKGSNLVCYLQVDTKISMKMFLVTQILDISTDLKHVQGHGTRCNKR